MTEPTPAGWYPDPGDSGQQRYWDGIAWTEHFAPGSVAAVPTAVAAKKPIYKRTWFIVAAVLIGLGVIGSMLIGSILIGALSTTPSTTPSATPESAPSVTESTPPPAEAVVEPEPAPAEEPAEPEMTMGQQQAVAKGQDYLGFAAFSRKGLIDQLVYEGFSTADATFAVDHISPDWNAQAAKKAQDYIDTMSFSRAGLIEQLVYEGFTKAQAEYGAKAVGF